MTSGPSKRFRLFTWITLIVFLGFGAVSPNLLSAFEHATGSDLDQSFQRAPQMREAPCATHTLVAKPSPGPVTPSDLAGANAEEIVPHPSPARRIAGDHVASQAERVRPTLVGVVEFRI